VTKYETFQNLEDWLKIVKDTNALGTMPLLALVANKSCVALLPIIACVCLECHNVVFFACH
jgi:hypothetical protein